jgi:hypothetical protein
MGQSAGNIHASVSPRRSGDFPIARGGYSVLMRM